MTEPKASKRAAAKTKSSGSLAAPGGADGKARRPRKRRSVIDVDAARPATPGRDEDNDSDEARDASEGDAAEADEDEGDEDEGEGDDDALLAEAGQIIDVGGDGGEAPNRRGEVPDEIEKV